MEHRVYKLCQTPLGPLAIAAANARLVALVPAAGVPRARLAETPLLRKAAAQLEEYFAGQRTVFGLPTAPAGTPFQKRVWQQLQAIPFGETRSYGQLAKALGSPGAARAVGAACRQNPLPLFIACHRVVGADGALTGYALGGVQNKRWLLNHEAAHLQVGN